MKLNYKSAIFAILIIFIISCDSNRWEVNLEKVQINQSFNRFELDLFALAEGSLTANEAEDLQKQYPVFYDLYLEGIMKFGVKENPLTLNELNKFVSNKDVIELFEFVKKQYPVGSLEGEKLALKDAFKRYKFHFPNRIVPEVFTMISTFNYSTVADDSLLAIGLDTYMGGDFPIYQQIGIPKYKTKNFSKEYLVSDAMKAWLLTDFDTDGGQNLMEQMIFHGKIAYLLSAILPEKKPHLFFNYNEVELIWCKNNEGPIWFHFVDMELLFTSESHIMRKYMGDAPFIAGFPEGSPGRVGQWLGFQVVKSFMENNKEVSLQELMKIENANKILRKSNYKPKR